MSEHVGMEWYIEALPAGALTEPLLDTTMRNSFTLATDKQGLLSWPDHLQPDRQPALNSLYGIAAYR